MRASPAAEHTKAAPPLAGVLGGPQLCAKDLGRGRCPDCARAPWPQMFGMWGGGSWACALGLVLSVRTDALRRASRAVLTPRGCWEMEALRSSCVFALMLAFATPPHSSASLRRGSCHDQLLVSESAWLSVMECRIEVMYSDACFVCFVYHLWCLFVMIINESVKGINYPYWTIHTLFCKIPVYNRAESR